LKLSPHFTLEEMTKSSVALRRGIENEPGSIEVGNLRNLCSDVLEPIRCHFDIPFSPSSAYRSLVLNNEIGSSSSSQHIKGEAADIEVPGVRNMDLARWISGNLEFDQLVLEYYSVTDSASGWVHVSYVGKNRNEVLSFNGTVWELGLKGSEEI